MCRKGLALVVAIAMLLIASAMQLAYIALYYNNYRMAEKLIKKIKSYYYTYSAQNAVWQSFLIAGWVTVGPVSGTIPGTSIAYSGEVQFIGGGPYQDGIPPLLYLVFPYYLWVQAPSEGTSEIEAYSKINTWGKYKKYSDIGGGDRIKKEFWQVVKPE